MIHIFQAYYFFKRIVRSPIYRSIRWSISVVLWSAIVITFILMHFLG